MWATRVLIEYLFRWWWNISDIYRPLLAPTLLLLQPWLIASEVTFKDTLKVLSIKFTSLPLISFCFFFFTITKSAALLFIDAWICPCMKLWRTLLLLCWLLFKHLTWTHLTHTQGTRIIYDRKFLLDCRSSPLARTPLHYLPTIPGVTTPSSSTENPQNGEALNNTGVPEGSMTGGETLMFRGKSISWHYVL